MRKNIISCVCIQCKECEGTRSVWWSFDGKYLGKHRCDDMDEFEPCEDCDGTGIYDLCDECRYKEAEEEYEQDEQDIRGI